MNIEINNNDSDVVLQVLDSIDAPALAPTETEDSEVFIAEDTADHVA